MKKYNRKQIMANAWNLIKTYGISRSVALKAAWALEKAMMAAESEGENCGWNYRVITNDWVKAGRNRTYIDLKVYTNAWNCKRTVRFGYIDNTTGKHIAA